MFFVHPRKASVSYYDKFIRRKRCDASELSFLDQIHIHFSGRLD
jgi:hypothetical protein